MGGVRWRRAGEDCVDEGDWMQAVGSVSDTNKILALMQVECALVHWYEQSCQVAAV